MSQYISYSSRNGTSSSSGVSSLNGEIGAINLVAGSGISVIPAGQNITIAATGSGGTVTNISVVSANGFAGTVANPTTTPAITLTTTITGLLEGNGTSISAASVGSSGSVLFSNGSTIAQDNTEFFWDETNKRLGIGNNAPTVTLDVSGEILATNTLPNDTSGFGGDIQVTSHVTTNGSITTIGIQGVASSMIDIGATNDKTLAGLVYTVQRGTGSDAGNLHNMTGASVLMFHNSDSAGSADEAVGFDSFFFSQSGTVTNLYDFRSQRVPSGGTIINHYGVYLSADTITPIKNWLSGSSLMGFSSFGSGPTAIVHLPGVTTSAGSASIKLNSGTLMTTPENGAIESNGTNLFWTDDTGTRQQLNGGSSGANTALSNLASTAINANLLPGTNNTLLLGDNTHKFLELHASGIFINATNKLIDVPNAVYNDITGQPLLNGNAFQLLNQGNLGLDFSDLTSYGFNFVDTHISSTLQLNSPPATINDPNSGVGATSALVGLSTDIAGKITMTTGVGTAAGPQVYMNYFNSYGGSSIVIITPNDDFTALSTVGYWANGMGTQFVINFANAPGSAETYTWNYHVIGV